MHSLRPPAVWRESKNSQTLLGKTGVIHYFTSIWSGPKNIIHRTPYCIALITLNDPKKNMLVEVCRESSDQIQVGAKVVLIRRKHQVSAKGLIQYVLKAKIIS